MTPLEAQQAALAGEHAAVYLFGVFGAQASQSRQPAWYARLLDAFHVHRRRRDQCGAPGGAPHCQDLRPTRGEHRRR